MNDWTSRMLLACRMILPDGSTKTYEVESPSVRLGRDLACEVAIDPIACPGVSGQHARVDARNGGFVLVHVSRSNKTLLNGSIVEKSSPLKCGDRVKLGFKGPTIELIALKAAAKGESSEASGKTLQADARDLALLRGTLGAKRIEIGQGGVIGRDPDVEFALKHPHVSGSHARLTVNRGRVSIADLGSSNGTFVNGQRLKKPAQLKLRDRIDIGPFSLVFDGNGLVSQSRSNNVELTAAGLKRVVKDRATGKPLVILEDVTLVIRPREFVCLLGPSGSGKSTLLAMLSGRNEPDEGLVAVNGADLYADFDAIKGDIAVVPQKDILHDSLAVGTALRYTAQLRLPPDTSRKELASSVSDILDVVGLSERRGTLIRHLSGGQVKRASLANELMSRPSLLFLDEVTSGLDEQTDQEVMQLFRHVADGGKTVVCVTHSLANVESTCNLVVVLTKGGRLAFFGSPAEAKEYFGIHRLGDVYSKLEGQKPQEWHARFRSSNYYRRYVTERKPVEKKGRIRSASRRNSKPPSTSFLRQSWVLTRRYLSILRGDPQALFAMLGQGLLIAGLLALVFGRLDEMNTPKRVPQTVNLQLLLAVSCFWFGCNAAAKELVKERIIFQRERAINLRVGAYFASKLTVLAVISIVQASLLWGVVQWWCRLPATRNFQWLTLSTLAVTGTAIGLLISALARSEELATALVPIVVIPQIILAGVIANLRGLALFIAKGFITVHWAQEALERLLPKDDLALLDGSREITPRDGRTWVGALAVILLHLAIAALMGLIVLWQAEEQQR
jgi:ABC transport system ATP-binding/permease protein